MSVCLNRKKGEKNVLIRNYYRECNNNCWSSAHRADERASTRRPIRSLVKRVRHVVAAKTVRIHGQSSDNCNYLLYLPIRERKRNQASSVAMEKVQRPMANNRTAPNSVYR